MEKIKCPCCGGETSNYLNCDYCGSYLVRFNKRNLSFNDSQLGKGAKCIQGIQEELQSNIDEQINTASRNHICSRTSSGSLTIDIKNPRAISDFVKYDVAHENVFVFPKNPFDENDISLILVVRVLEFSKSQAKSSDFMEMKQLQENQKLEWLKHTGLYEICAKADDPILSMEGEVGICHSFYINFGQDITGASRAITSFLFGNNHSQDETLTFKRSSDQEIVYRSKLKKLDDDKKNYSKNFYITALVSYIAFVIFILYKFTGSKYSRRFEDLGIFLGVATIAFVIFILYVRFSGKFRKNKNSISKYIDKSLN